MPTLQPIEQTPLPEKVCRLLIYLPLMLGMVFFLAACGKKSPPTLKEYEKPVPPSLLRATHREDRIILQWNFPAGKENMLTGFVILKSFAAEFSVLADAGKDVRSYEDFDFENNKCYKYKVVARNFKGVYSDDSNSVEVCPLEPPPPPSGLSFTVQDDTLVLTWKPAGQGLFYNVYKSLEKGKYGLAPVNSNPLSESSFKDAFTMNKTVYYTVRSLYGGGIRDEGIASEELAADPSELIPPRPKNFRYHAFPDKVYLFWDEPEEIWVTGFRIYRRAAGQDYLPIGETQIPVFVDNEPALTKRDYRVHAIGPAKEGPGAEIRDIFYKPE